MTPKWIKSPLLHTPYATILYYPLEKQPHFKTLNTLICTWAVQVWTSLHGLWMMFDTQNVKDEIQSLHAHIYSPAHAHVYWDMELKPLGKRKKYKSNLRQVARYRRYLQKQLLPLGMIMQGGHLQLSTLQSSLPSAPMKFIMNFAL